MKKDIPTPVIIGLIVVIVLIVGGLGFSWFQGATGSAPEDPALVQKQLEAEIARRPGGAPSGEQTTTPGGTTDPSATSGFSPGRGGEMEARQQGGN
jgi:hypothetical protein